MITDYHLTPIFVPVPPYPPQGIWEVELLPLQREQVSHTLPNPSTFPHMVFTYWGCIFAFIFMVSRFLTSDLYYGDFNFHVCEYAPNCRAHFLRLSLFGTGIHSHTQRSLMPMGTFSFSRKEGYYPIGKFLLQLFKS